MSAAGLHVRQGGPVATCCCVDLLLLWWLPQDMACADDRQIVALIWAHIEQLLNSGQGADATVRCEHRLLLSCVGPSHQQ